MIELKTWQLKQFQKLTSSIRENEKNPILNNIKIFPDGFLVKTNEEIFCIMKADLVLAQSEMFASTEANGIQEPILVDEKKLFALVNTTKAETIKIKFKDENNLVITDGKMKAPHQVVDALLYPKLPDVPDDFDIVFDSELIKAVNVARAFSSADVNAANFQAIHIKDNFVVGISYEGFYYKEFKKEFPHVVLYNKHATMITQFEAIQYKDTPHHQIFKIGNELVYGFRKTEWNTPDLSRQIEMIKNLEEPMFKINKVDLVDFCQVVNQISESAIVVAEMGEEDGIQKLMIRGDKTGSNPDKEIAVEGKLVNFRFNPKLLINHFKSLPQEKFTCMVASHTLLILEQDASFACFYGRAEAQNG